MREQKFRSHVFCNNYKRRFQASFVISGCAILAFQQSISLNKRYQNTLQPPRKFPHSAQSSHDSLPGIAFLQIIYKLKPSNIPLNAFLLSVFCRYLFCLFRCKRLMIIIVMTNVLFHATRNVTTLSY